MVFNQNLFSKMLEVAVENIQQQVPYLNELDSKTGDGDHGTTMLRVCHCIEGFLKEEPQEWGKQIDALGWNIMSQDGGSAGMLVGNLFMGIASGITDEALSTIQVAAAMRAGLDKMVSFSGAKQGDKTMFDALIPAVEALESEATRGADIEDLFAKAALAARAGSEATKEMVPTRGRAKNMGEKAVGFIDPGATSIAILFESFNQAITE